MVECDLAKVEVAGSNPVSRSITCRGDPCTPNGRSSPRGSQAHPALSAPAALALGGAAIFYQSLALLGYLSLFVLITHVFVMWYEEPTLHRNFGEEYDVCWQQVRRWWPTF